MADEIRLKWPVNYGRAWVELLESDLSEHARICYVAMTSFGEVSRAGKDAIRRRMGVKSVSTVKEAQRELIEAGWITLSKRGGGVSPNVWEVNDIPGRITAGSQGDLLPGRITAPKQEGKQEDIDMLIDKKKAKENPLKAEVEVLKTLWFSKWGPHVNQTGDYLSKKDEKILEVFVKAGVDPATFGAKVDAYLALDRDYQRGKRWPLWLFEQTWGELNAGAATKKACAHEWAKCKVLTDYGMTVRVECECGKKFTRAKEA